MPLPKFDYIRPKTMRKLVSALATHRADTKIIAGGTDLVVLLRDKIVRPKYVVDIKGVRELHKLSWNKNLGLTIGAAVTLKELLDSDIVKQKFGALWKAASTLADPTIRNRATLVGNICNASPASDTAPALLVLDAKVEVVGKKGKRTVAIKDFFKGVKKTALKPGEFVRAVKVPNPPEGARSDYLKWGRTAGEDLSVVGVAALVADSDEKLVRVALSSVAPTPLLVPDVESAFRDGGSLDEKIERAVSIVQSKICPISDVRCCKEYRLYMAGVLTSRVLKQLLGVADVQA